MKRERGAFEELAERLGISSPEDDAQDGVFTKILRDDRELAAQVLQALSYVNLLKMEARERVAVRTFRCGKCGLMFREPLQGRRVRVGARTVVRRDHTERCQRRRDEHEATCTATRRRTRATVTESRSARAFASAHTPVPGTALP